MDGASRRVGRERAAGESVTFEEDVVDDVSRLPARRRKPEAASQLGWVLALSRAAKE
jgi:hypothetical protein